MITREAPMGDVCKIPQGLMCCLGQRQVLLRPKAGVNPDYLLYALQSPSVQDQIRWNEGTGSTVSNIRIPVLEKIEIPRLGSAEEPVAAALKSLDDKIDLNRRVNQTLEAITQAIFKSWFVDFDPVKAKMAAIQEGRDPLRAAMSAISGMIKTELDALKPEQYGPLAATAALFPDGMEESDLGEIPSGWSSAIISEIANVVMGQSPDGDTYNDSGVGTALINGPVEFDTYHPKRIKWTTQPTKTSEVGDLIICVRGSTTGKYVKSDGIYCLGRGVCAIRAQEQSWQPFVDQTYKFSLTALLPLATGSTFPNWSGPTLKNHRILRPKTDVIAAFSLLVKPSISQISANDREITSLSALRDTVLLKFISGELPIETLVAAIEDA